MKPATPRSSASNASPVPAGTGGNFLRNRIEQDLERGYDTRRTWSGQPAAMATDGLGAAPDPARVRTRFPPEPNGYLHIGHAKAIALDFGLARSYGGVCHMRFDDTNPEKEDQEYVDSILESVRWLGFDWSASPEEMSLARASQDSDATSGKARPHLYFASDYFESLYEFAEYLVTTGHAYVDEQDAESIRSTRGTLNEPGRPSPWRERTAAESLERLREMRAGRHPEGSMVLRARIDMASPNINLRDPVLYRIRFAEHHRTGAEWCIYPMYDYTHCVSDALENITHSICTLEFEDHRPLYDWVLERIVPVLRAPLFRIAIDHVESLRERGLEAQKEFALHCHNFRHKLFASAAEARMRELFEHWEHDRNAVLRDLDTFFDLLLKQPEQFTPLLTHALEEALPNPFALPHQYEFSRLNLTYVVTSKRKLRQMVTEGIVDGWDDPRMPTLVGLRRRGYTAEALLLFCERLGVSRAESWIDYSVLEGALRDDLDAKAPRATAVLSPLRLVIDNYPEGQTEACSAPVHPHHPELGKREFPFARELWIEAEDFTEQPPKGYFRLYPGNRVRLRHGYVIECTGCDKDADGNIIAVHANYFPDSKSGTPGSDTYKVKGNIHWLAVQSALDAEVRLYDRMFTEAQPDAAGGDWLACLNPDARRVIRAMLEPGLSSTLPGTRYQFERHGYFIADGVDSKPGQLVFNRITTLKDSWAK